MTKYLKVGFIIVFPYTIVFSMVCLFQGYFMDTFFQNNALLLLPFLFVAFVIALFNALAVSIMNVAKKRKSFQILRVNMVVKLVQIPAYLFIFIFGALCMFTIFTYAITLILMVLDGMAITLSGFVGLSGVIRGLREKKISKKSAVIYSIFQFAFCADVISSIILYRTVRKHKCVQESCDNK